MQASRKWWSTISIRPTSLLMPPPSSKKYLDPHPARSPAPRRQNACHGLQNAGGRVRRCHQFRGHPGRIVPQPCRKSYQDGSSSLPNCDRIWASHEESSFSPQWRQISLLESWRSQRPRTSIKGHPRLSIIKSTQLRKIPFRSGRPSLHPQHSRQSQKLRYRQYQSRSHSGFSYRRFNFPQWFPHQEISLRFNWSHD